MTLIQRERLSGFCPNLSSTILFLLLSVHFAWRCLLCAGLLVRGLFSDDRLFSDGALFAGREQLGVFDQLQDTEVLDLLLLLLDLLEQFLLLGGEDLHTLTFGANLLLHFF